MNDPCPVLSIEKALKAVSRFNLVEELRILHAVGKTASTSGGKYELVVCSYRGVPGFPPVLACSVREWYRTSGGETDWREVLRFNIR